MGREKSFQEGGTACVKVLYLGCDAVVGLREGSVSRKENDGEAEIRLYWPVEHCKDLLFY